MTRVSPRFLAKARIASTSSSPTPADRAAGRWVDQEGGARRAGAVAHRIAVVAFVILQQDGELGLVTAFCVPDLHGGRSNTAGREQQRRSKSAQR
jgi:hypothetical protein